MIEVGIVQHLLADPDVASLCGTRIYPLLLPETVSFPAATYQTISTVSDYTFDGASGFTQARIQIDVWATRYLDAKSLSEAIRSVLDAFDGTLPDGTKQVFIMRDNSTDLYENQAELYRVQTDWLVLYSA